MTAITHTDIVKSGILKKLARLGKEFTIKMRGEPDLLVIPQTAHNTKKKVVKCTETLTIPEIYKTIDKDYSNYDIDQPIVFRPATDGETYATISPSFEHYFTATDFNQS